MKSIVIDNSDIIYNIFPPYRSSDICTFLSIQKPCCIVVDASNIGNNIASLFKGYSEYIFIFSRFFYCSYERIVTIMTKHTNLHTWFKLYFSKPLPGNSTKSSCNKINVFIISRFFIFVSFYCIASFFRCTSKLTKTFLINTVHY